MQSSFLPPTPAHVSAEIERLTLRVFLGFGLVAGLVGVMAFAWLPLQLSTAVRAGLLGACLLLAAVFGGSALALRRIGLPTATRIAGWTTLFVILLASLLLGNALGSGSGSAPGLGATALALFAVVVCISCITAGPATGAAMSAFAALVIGGFAWAEATHRLPGGSAASLSSWSSGLSTPAPSPPIPFSSSSSSLPVSSVTLMPLGLRVTAQLLAIAAGLAGGLLVSRVTRAFMQAAHERERRFGGLLRIAADWYWEMDAAFRFTHLAEGTPGASLVGADTRLGATPWDILNFGIDAATMDAHRSDLEAHRSFRGLLVRRRDASGRPRYARVSGQPRFDARGVFTGYWGVGRDTTPEVTAQVSVAASEARYRDLFNRTPSALVLHRAGRIVDANPAAVALLGYRTLADMLGQPVRRHIADADVAEAWAQGAARIETMRVGEGLDAIPLRLQTADGRIRYVRGSPVKIDAPEGPAVLSIFHDETEQRLADAALRRSQSLLAHLVESSPDSITLCEADSGRYVMVNEAFVRWFGFSADETVGRTGAELGIWAHDEEHTALVEAIRRHGRVDNFPAVFFDRQRAPIRVMVSGACFEEDGAVYIVMASRDITAAERTRLEHQAILQSASIGIAFTRDERFLHTNPQFERIFGWPEGALGGERGSVIWPSMREYEEVGGIAGPLLSAAKPVELERPMRRLDGTIFWCRLLAKVVDPRAPAQGGTIWIAEDVTEKRRVEQALANARDDAEAATRAKSAFLANTSHEIRTPLNGLLGMAQLALNDQLDDTRRRQYIQQIHDSAQSLTGIISDILDFSKIEAGKFTVESLPFGLHDLLQAIHRAYQPLAEAKGLSLTLSIAPDLPRAVLGDGLRVRQIITNYVSNALKFTVHGSVRIQAARQHGGWVRLQVSDSGPGIDPQTVQRLFTPFTQADGSTTRRHGGTGLGLSICRQLAQLMHGDVGVSSDPGQGSSFWADLPLAEVAVGAEGMPLPAPLHADMPAIDAPPVDPFAILRGARVLVAEDNPVNMMITVAMLEQWGITTAQAVDGAAAVEAATAAAWQGSPFDLVLMDVQMPRMSGHEAARQLRTSFDTWQLPIIALTAAALVAEREQAIAAGMNDFLTKPIDANRLRDSLAHHLTQRQRIGLDETGLKHGVG